GSCRELGAQDLLLRRWEHPKVLLSRPFVATGVLEVGPNHHLDELLKPYGGLPTELFLRFGGVSKQKVDLCRAVELRVHSYADRSVPVARAGARAFAFPFKSQVTGLRRQTDELSNRMLSARRKHVVVCVVCLEHLPHAYDVISRISPVA